MKEVKIGLIGCGGMGAGLVKRVATVDGVKIVATADPDAEAGERVAKEFGAKAYTDYADLLRHPGVEAVIVASPPFAHAEETIAAAQAGKHVFCEKPMAPTVAECEQMIAACEKAGVKLMIGQVLRYYPNWWKIISLVRSGDFGQPIGVVVTRIGGGFGAANRPWRESKEQSGGLLMEINAHELDFMRCICGEADSVFANMGLWRQPKTILADQCFVMIHYRSGASGVLHSSHASALGESSGMVLCEKGTIRYGGGFSGKIQCAWFDKDTEEISLEDIKKEDPVREETRRFVEAVQKDEPVPITGTDGKRAVELAEAAYLSYERGEPVKLPLTENIDLAV